ncbi:hypothetical protein TNCV_2088401 [Trichonephila clavipes]|nr:hypothetical protein TNCV_2088401 [Trichonephila clavipes]
MAKHKPRKSAPTEYTTDDEDMLMYDVEEELEPDPTDKFVLKEDPSNFPRGYLRSLTPTTEGLSSDKPPNRDICSCTSAPNGHVYWDGHSSSWPSWIVVPLSLSFKFEDCLTLWGYPLDKYVFPLICN